MTKRRLSEMEVVEIDAIDLGDWERNMATSEVPMAHLAPLVRQTKAGPAVAEPQPRPTSPDVASTTARPSVAPSTITPASEALPESEAPPPAIRGRFASPRTLLIGGGALAAVLVVIAIAVHGSGSTPAAEPVVAAASPAPPSRAPDVTSRPEVKLAPKPAVAAVSKPDVPTTVAAPATKTAVAASAMKTTSNAKPATPTHHSHASHHHAAHKTVAARAAPHADAAGDPGSVDRAREAYNAGNEALFAGNFDDAIRSYKEAVEVSPTHAFGYRGLGLAYAEKGDNAAAIAALREYLRLAPHAKDVALIRRRISGLQTAHH
jgi:hypothetical protein